MSPVRQTIYDVEEEDGGIFLFLELFQNSPLNLYVWCLSFSSCTTPHPIVHPLNHRFLPRLLTFSHYAPPVLLAHGMVIVTVALTV